jgi:GntR family transcriptional regulator/MocR family aminotransferase
LLEKDLSSHPAEILLSVDRGDAAPLRAQIERQLREAVRSGALKPGSAIPSTRELARDLGVSRPLVMEAYSQLAAEGYLALSQGAAPRVGEMTLPAAAEIAIEPRTESLRYDFRPGVPDLTSFPQKAWLKATEVALGKMSAAEFGYSERHGATALREALARYLGRVRGVSASAGQILVTSGFEQARSFLSRALWRAGRRRIAVEEPGYADREVFIEQGFELIPVPVDDEGIDVEALAETNAEVVLTTPAHQYPTGVVMSGPRRLALAAWLRRTKAVAVEDDYDAEFRYDRAPVGALQGLVPEHVVYAGTASKTLAPALRLGWLVVPPSLLDALKVELHVDYGRSRIEQHALAHLIERGDFDRHLRRMRSVYAARRAALLEAVASELPGCVVSGVSAGLHATVRLPGRIDEPEVVARALERSIGLRFMSHHYLGRKPRASTMLLSYSGRSESAIRSGIRGLAAVLSA